MTFDWPTTAARGKLPRKNASRAEADASLTFEASTRHATAGQPSYYLPRAFNGIDMRPRAFCVAERDPEAQLLDRERPYVRSAADVVRSATTLWKGVAISGRVEVRYLYATSLSVEPYRLAPLKLAVLPVLLPPAGKLEVISQQAVLNQGDVGMAQWLADCEAAFAAGLQRAGRPKRGTMIDYINVQNKLAEHLPQRPRVVWGKGGSNVRAAVVPHDVQAVDGLPVQGYVVDLNQYSVVCGDMDEAHYLCAVLNTNLVNQAIKAVQTVGQQGERDIHRRPLEEVPIPRYRSTDSIHRKLSDLSREAHKRAPKITVNSHGARKRYYEQLGQLAADIEELSLGLVQGAREQGTAA